MRQRQSVANTRNSLSPPHASGRGLFRHISAKYCSAVCPLSKNMLLELMPDVGPEAVPSPSNKILRADLIQSTLTLCPISPNVAGKSCPRLRNLEQ